MLLDSSADQLFLLRKLGEAQARAIDAVLKSAFSGPFEGDTHRRGAEWAPHEPASQLEVMSSEVVAAWLAKQQVGILAMVNHVEGELSECLVDPTRVLLQTYTGKFATPQQSEGDTCGLVRRVS